MEKILVVDDEESIRKLYDSELSEEGYSVVLASNAKEAVEKLKQDSPDIVVLDIRMEGVDGLDCLKEMLEIRRGIPVILNSAYSEFRSDFTSWLADAYLVKSADLNPLKSKIREILDTKARESGV